MKMFAVEDFDRSVAMGVKAARIESMLPTYETTSSSSWSMKSSIARDAVLPSGWSWLSSAFREVARCGVRRSAGVALALDVFEDGEARAREAGGERSNPSGEEGARQSGEGANLDEVDTEWIDEWDPEGAQAAKGRRSQFTRRESGLLES